MNHDEWQEVVRANSTLREKSIQLVAFFTAIVSGAGVVVLVAWIADGWPLWIGIPAVICSAIVGAALALGGGFGYLDYRWNKVGQAAVDRIQRD